MKIDAQKKGKRHASDIYRRKEKIIIHSSSNLFVHQSLYAR